jgi:hypothetical protein
MKRLGNWVMAGLVGGLLLASCFDPPQYSPIPVIEFDNIVFKDLSDPSASDSLILTIRFKDGDGNLGLDPNEQGCYQIGGQSVCYNDKFYYKLADGSYITYKHYRQNHASGKNDTLPAFIKPANCLKWDVNSKVTGKLDTFYVQQNRNYYNIFIEFWIKNDFPAGTYTQYKIEEQFGYPQCANSFNGRFPILSKDLSQNTPLDGTIRYAMQSVAFNLLFSIKTLNLKITIQDRLLNRSNTIETGDFDLTKIRKSG